jgi:hypothetical protein
VAEEAEVDAEQRPQAAAVARVVPAVLVQPEQLADAVERLQQVERQLQVEVDAVARPPQRGRSTRWLSDSLQPESS